MIFETKELLLDVLVIVNILFCINVIFNERKNPTVTWAWLFILIALPYVGFILYLFIGLDIRKHRFFLKKWKNDKLLYKNFLKHKCQADISEDYTRFKGLIDLNLSSGYGDFKDNNEIKIYIDGTEKFKDLLEDIKNAKKFVHLEYYIFKNDNIGTEIVNILTQKAKEGIEVKFMIDGMGCLFVPKKFFKEYKNSGGQLATFFPPHFARFKYRNHRKLAIIDGSIGYIGGINIGDEYLGKNKKFGYWRDTHIKIVGDSVKDLEARFIMDWNFTSKQKMDNLDKYFPELEVMENKTGIQIVSSGPDTKYPFIQCSYFKMITEAKKSIYIQTPYFIPDDSILEALRIAALSGIDVKIITPSKADHFFVYSAGMSYLWELMEAGVNCYKYNSGFIHSKIIVVDDLVFSIGSANMDLRSFKLNFEVNSFIFDENNAKKISNIFNNDINECIQLDYAMYKNRSIFQKFREAIDKLLSSML